MRASSTLESQTSPKYIYWSLPPREGSGRAHLSHYKLLQIILGKANEIPVLINGH